MAKVFVADDSKEIRDSLKRLLEIKEHEVILEASSVDEALSMISQIEELEIKIAIVDGNLKSSKEEGADGALIARSLRDEIPDIKIISFSGKLQSYGDENIEKTNPEFIDAIFQAIVDVMAR